jgi:hypothetical protein
LKLSCSMPWETRGKGKAERWQVRMRLTVGESESIEARIRPPTVLLRHSIAVSHSEYDMTYGDSIPMFLLAWSTHLEVSCMVLFSMETPTAKVGPRGQGGVPKRYVVQCLFCCTSTPMVA